MPALYHRVSFPRLFVFIGGAVHPACSDAGRAFFFRRDVRSVHGIQFCPAEPLNTTQLIREAL